MFIFKIGGIFVAIWKFFKYFFTQLYTAIKFSIINYDSKLQMTKTPKQRVIFWTIAGLITLAILFVLLRLVGNFFINTVHI